MTYKNVTINRNNKLKDCLLELIDLYKNKFLSKNKTYKLGTYNYQY